MNPILEWIVAGEHALGWAAYEAIAAPTPEDDRFGGMCLFNLHELQRAKNLLLRARARGCDAAGIDLATVYRQLGHVGLSRSVLDRVDPTRLSTFDRTLALRERGAQHYTAGELIRATEVLEDAWELAYEAAMGHALLPAIGQALGLAYASRGLDRRAVGYLADALTHAHRARAAQLRATRALCLAYLGDVEEAESDLAAAAADQEFVPLVVPHVKYVGGVLQLIRGHLPEADRLFGESASAARAAQESETESYAELGRCAVATALGRTHEAAGHLARARSISVNEKLAALALLREGALMCRTGRGDALRVLASASSSFARLGLVREQAWVCLHVAEVHLSAGRRREGLSALSEAAVLRHALGAGGSLVIEMRVLPALVVELAGTADGTYARVLHHDLQRVPGATPRRLELRTLGTRELLLDGRRVRLDLRRSHEVFAYLLDHPDSTLERVLLDLFADSDQPHGRSYFHQVRYELARAVTGLAVPFDSATKTYRVRWDRLSLESDIASFKGALARGGEEGLVEALALYRGPFLPSADSEWARTEREDVAWSAVRLGLEVLEDWYAQGLYAKCLGLAGRLLEIEPYDEVLNEYVVNAAHAAGGRAAALHEIDRLARRFERDLGSVPPGLARLRHTS